MTDVEPGSGEDEQAGAADRDTDRDVEPTKVPDTSPFGITVPVPIVSDRDLGIGRVGAHSADAPRAGAILAGTASAPATPPPSAPTSPLRAALLWAGIAVLLVAAFAAAVGALNHDIYSPAGFVRQYLSAIEDGDSAAALDFPGVQVAASERTAAGLPADAATTLLRDSVLRAPADMRFEGDEETAPGRHSVTYSGVIAGHREKLVFDVESTGTWAGLFSGWRFATSPLGSVTVNVKHDSSFTVNGLTLDTRAHAASDAEPSFNNSASYLVLTPGAYEFSRTSRLLEAAPQTVPLTKPGSSEVVVDVEPSATFVSEVQTEIDGFLDTCATQEVLQPTGCPFGTVIDDRIISTPAWSIVAYPKVTIAADDEAFRMPPADGIAHIVVQIQSLFDAEESTLERDETYTMSATIVIGADDTLNIRLE
jgi:hypothetical protein